MIEHAFIELSSTLFQSNGFLSVPWVKSSGEQDRSSTSKSCSQTTKARGHPHLSGGSRGSYRTPIHPSFSSVPLHPTAVSRAWLFSWRCPLPGAASHAELLRVRSPKCPKSATQLPAPWQEAEAGITPGCISKPKNPCFKSVASFVQ